MTPGADLQQNLRRYLLGQLDDHTAEATEKQFLVQEDVFDELLAAEDELIDDYLTEELTPNDREAFERHFLSTSERKEQLRFGRVFKRYLANESGTTDALQSGRGAPLANAVDRVPLTTRVADVGSPWWKSPGAFFSSPWRAVAFAVVLLVVALGIWRFYRPQSDVDKGLVALNAAYRQQRPLESRISNFDYAPYVVTRGPGDERVDQNELRRAELTLLNELNANATPAVHHALGKVYLAKKDFDKAIEQFNEALKGDSNNAQIYSDIGAAWLEKGRTDSEGKDPGKGMEDLGRSLDSLNKALELNPNLLEALFNRALCRQWLKHYHQADDDWREYLKRDANSPWASEAAQRLRELESQSEKTSQSKERLLQDFLTAYQASDDESAWAAISRSRERKGNLIVEKLLDEYLNLTIANRHDEAAAKLTALEYEARIEREKCEDQFTSDLVHFYRNASPAQRDLSVQARQVAKSANALYYKVEFEQALALYPKALQLFNQAGNECEALFTESWIGYCYLRIPKVKESLETLERTAKVYEQRNYRSLYAQSCNALSDARFSLNEFSKALDYASRSLKLSETIADRVNVVRSYGQILSVQLNLGSYREALSAMFRGLDFAQSSVYDPTLVWHLYYEGALAYYSQGLNSAAFDCETEGRRLADISDNPLLRARTLDRLALFYERSHDYQQAVALLNQALSEAETISGKSSKALTQVHTHLGLGQLYREMGDFPQAIANYDRTLDLSTQLNNLEFYLYQAHTGKLLALIDLHDDESAETELDTVISLFEDYREKIIEESYRNRFFEIGQNTYDVAVDFEYSRQGNFEKAFKFAEAYRARSLYELMVNGGAIDLTDLPSRLPAGTQPLDYYELQARIPEQVQILEYSVIDDRVIIWVLTKQGLEHAEANIGSSDLSKKIGEFRDAIIRSPTDNTASDRLGRELYAELIAPVELRGYLRRDRELCIVPDKALNFLPFAALISPSSGQYLIQTYVLQIAPSATVFVKSSENAELREGTRRESILTVGDPRFDRTEFTNLPDLPLAKREAQEVAGFYQHATLLVEDKATSSKVKQALPAADIVHFATHAVIDTASPLQSKLLLANESWSQAKAHHAVNGYLTASEIYKMRLPRTRVVVLSACQTGVEQAYGGEGAIGLARPFLAARVPLVVASLWPVDSVPTAKLMISFHRHRKRDQVSTTEALRLAQLEMLADPDQSLRRPYVWAAFVPIGGYTIF